MNPISQNGVIKHNGGSVLSERSESKDEVINPVGTNHDSPKHDSPTLADSITQFLDLLQSNHIAENTIRSYALDIRRFSEFMHQRGHSDFTEVRTSDIDLFFRQLSIQDSSASTIRRTRAGLKKFFRFLYENGTTSANPFESTLLEETFADRLTLSTVLNIVVYCRRHYEAESTGEALRYRRDELILLLMLIYGVRQYSIPSLKLSAMKRDGNSVLIVVSDEFFIRLGGTVLHKLYEYLKRRNSKADIIFTEHPSGKPVASRTLHSLMIELSYAVRVQVNPRTLYHTFLHLQRHPEDASQLIRELTKLDEEPA